MPPEPINPVTIRGVTKPDFPFEFRNISIARLWVGSSKAGQLPHQERLGACDKTMTFMVWDNEDKPQVLASVCSTEKVFIPAMQELRANGTVANISGPSTRGGADRLDVNFGRLDPPYQGWVCIMVHNFGPERISMKTELYVRWNMLWEGLSHLFPAGEITPPEEN